MVLAVWYVLNTISNNISSPHNLQTEIVSTKYDRLKCGIINIEWYRYLPFLFLLLFAYWQLANHPFIVHYRQQLVVSSMVARCQSCCRHLDVEP